MADPASYDQLTVKMKMKRFTRQPGGRWAVQLYLPAVESKKYFSLGVTTLLRICIAPALEPQQ